MNSTIKLVNATIRYLNKTAIFIQQVDVIVNIISSDLKLDTGDICKTISQKDGKSIQDECRQFAKRVIDPGEMVSTTGGRLPCRNIYHGNLIHCEKEDFERVSNIPMASTYDK